MENFGIQDFMIHEDNYQKEMLEIAEPYLAARKKELSFQSGVPAHPARRRFDILFRRLWADASEEQRIFCACYRAEKPRGIVLISHGFSESAEKHLEAAYYFVKMGYHVFIPEHCGHGRSYRLTKDPSLVHVDRYERYAADLLRIARAIHRRCPELPLFLFGHSRGGGIAAAAAAADSSDPCIRKLILTSPMIRPSTGNLPWRTARAIARACCRYGKGKSYVPGHHPYRGPEPFERSASACRPRFDYYQQKKSREPLFQTSAASCQWLYAAFRLYRYLILTGCRKISCPVTLFQADRESLVSQRAQQRFIRRINNAARYHSARTAKPAARLIPVPGSKHEIFNSGDEVLAGYWRQVFDFLSE